MLDDILKSMHPNRHAWMNAIAILFFVVSIAVLISSLINYVARVDEEDIVSTNVTSQISNQEKISIMTKPSGLPVKNPNMTDEEKVKIMTGKK